MGNFGSKILSPTISTITDSTGVISNSPITTNNYLVISHSVVIIASVLIHLLRGIEYCYTRYFVPKIMTSTFEQEINGYGGSFEDVVAMSERQNDIDRYLKDTELKIKTLKWQLKKLELKNKQRTNNTISGESVDYTDLV